MPRRATDPADALFRAFEHVARPGMEETCQCCYSEQEQRELLAPVPLRELPGSIIYHLAGYLRYADRVIDGVDHMAGHVRYFTPRLLIDPLDPDWTVPELELMARRIRIAGFDTWPARLREGVLGFLRETWVRVIRTSQGNPKLWTVLAAIGELEPDVTPYLSRWTAALAEPAAARRLQWLLDELKFSNSLLLRPAASSATGLDLGQVNAWLETLRDPVIQAWLDAPSAEAREALEGLESRLAAWVRT